MLGARVERHPPQTCALKTAKIPIQISAQNAYQVINSFHLSYKFEFICIVPTLVVFRAIEQSGEKKLLMQNSNYDAQFTALSHCRRFITRFWTACTTTGVTSWKTAQKMVYKIKNI